MSARPKQTRRYLKPLVAEQPLAVTIEAARSRFESKIDRSGDCWIWTAARSQDGYGVFRFRGKVEGAHRVALLMSGQQLVEGLEVDHACRNRACVNPAHLRQVSHRENIVANSAAPMARHAAQTVCLRGHPFNAENTGRTPRGRYCMACRREKQNATNRAKRAGCNVGT